MGYTIQVSGSVLSLVFDETLTTNRQYTVTLSPGISGVYNETSYSLESEYSFWFTSAYCPIFSSLTQVKLATGPVADYFTDDTIYRMIHKNSLDAVELFNVNNGYAIPYDYWGCTWHDIPYILRKYVECKTAYDILALYQSMVTGSMGATGSQLKALGDMTISYKPNTSSSASADNPDRKKELYDCWTELLRSIKNIRYAVKGRFDYTKGYKHPVADVLHNRINKPVVPETRNLTPGTTYRRTF